MKTPQLILMRHGRSAWNQKNLFTGWVDIPLDEQGIQEVIEGGKQIREIDIDIVYTSSLIRAQMTVVLALLHQRNGKIPVFQHPGEGKMGEWGRIYSDATQAQMIPVYSAWELNERMYGQLQGLNKAETAEQFGQTQVHLWRRSFDQAPPGGESLEMTAQRTLPFFQKQILPHLEKGETVFIAAHHNSLRSIMMHLDGLSKEEVVRLELQTGAPIIYRYEKNRWSR